MQPQQFLDLMQCAFFESNTQRSQAEQVLLKHKDECPDEFMVYCASGDVDDEYQGLAFIIDFAGVNTYELVKNFIQNTLTQQQ